MPLFLDYFSIFLVIYHSHLVVFLPISLALVTFNASAANCRRQRHHVCRLSGRPAVRYPFVRLLSVNNYFAWHDRFT